MERSRREVSTTDDIIQEAQQRRALMQREVEKWKKRKRKL